MAKRLFILFGIVAGAALLWYLYKKFLSREARALQESAEAQLREFGKDLAKIEMWEKKNIDHLHGTLVTSLTKEEIQAVVMRFRRDSNSNDTPIYSGFFLVESRVLRPITSAGKKINDSQIEALKNAAFRNQDFFNKAKKGAGITLKKAGYN